MAINLFIKRNYTLVNIGGQTLKTKKFESLIPKIQRYELTIREKLNKNRRSGD